MPSEIFVDKISGNYTSEEKDLSGFVDAFVQVWSESTSSAVVNLEARTNVTGSGWFDLNAATTDPDSEGVIWSIPTVGKIRAVISNYASGTISVSLTLKNRGDR